MTENMNTEIMEFLKSNEVITSSTDNENKLISQGYTKLSENAGVVFSHLPAILGTVAAADTYYIRLPQGYTVHDLMRLTRNGELTTTLRKNGKFAGQASLVSTTPVSVALGVFTVLSIVTSQYFLKEINDKLDQIQKQLNSVIDIIKLEKASILQANIQFISEIYRDLSIVYQNHDYLRAVISKILDIKCQSIADITFYSAMINKSLHELNMNSKDKIDDIQNAITILSNYKQCYTLAISLYMSACTMQIVCTDNSDNTEYINTIKKDLETVQTNYKETICRNYIDKCNEYIGIQKSKHGLQSDKDNKRIADLSNRFSQIFDKDIEHNENDKLYDNYLNNIQELEMFNNKGAEYAVCGNNLYIKRN